MGCCPSKTRKPNPTRPKPQPTTRSASTSRHVAPPQEDEPVVKEVLSETPKPFLSRNPTRPITRPDPKPVSETTRMIKPVSETTRIIKPISEITRIIKPEINQKPETADVSEASEMSVSTVPEEEFSGEVRRKITRSPAKAQARSYSGRVRATGMSPGRVGSVPGRERNPDRVRERNTGRREMYCGRLNDSPSIKRNNGKSVVKIASENSNNNNYNHNNVANNNNNVTRKIEGPVGGDESLENPLVSLECFIFL